MPSSGDGAWLSGLPRSNTRGNGRRLLAAVELSDGGDRRRTVALAATAA